MPLKLSCMSVHVLYDSAFSISGTVLVLSAPLLFFVAALACRWWYMWISGWYIPSSLSLLIVASVLRIRLYCFSLLCWLLMNLPVPSYYDSLIIFSGSCVMIPSHSSSCIGLNCMLSDRLAFLRFIASAFILVFLFLFS